MTSGRVHRPHGPLPIHPTLLALAWVIDAWVAAGVSPYAAVRAIGLAVILSVTLTVVTALTMRDLQLGGLVALSLVIGVLSQQVLAVWIMSVALGVVLVALGRRRDLPLAATTRGLNLIGTSVIIVIAAGWAVGGGVGRLAPDMRQGRPDLPTAPAGASASGLPDIFFIQLDGHPRGDWMVTAFGAPTDAFAGELRRRGFEISARARSNYDETMFTLPSMLGATYLSAVPGLEARIRDGPYAEAELRRLANNGIAFTELGAHGYTSIAIGSGWEFIALRQADVYFDPGPLNEFETSLVQRSALESAAEAAVTDPWGEALRVRLRLTFDELSGVATSSLPHPAFVYAHVPAPHTPVVVDAGGGAVDTGFVPDTSKAPDAARFVAQYRAQVEYVDGRALDAIDTILASAAPSTVIVLFSDHGSRIQPLGEGPMDDLERTSILLAIRAPGHPGLLRDDISLVNLMPAVLDALLGTALEEQPDRSYVFDVKSHTFRLLAPAPSMP
jgi:hypothetical protein